MLLSAKSAVEYSPQYEMIAPTSFTIEGRCSNPENIPLTTIEVTDNITVTIKSLHNVDVKIENCGDGEYMRVFINGIEIHVPAID